MLGTGLSSDATNDRLTAIIERLDGFEMTVEQTLSDVQCVVQGYQERMEALENNLGATQTVLQELAVTVEDLQQDEPNVVVPPPPTPAFPRPERAAGDRRRVAAVESEADVASSAGAGTDATVQGLVEAIQTSQKEADKIELPNIPEGNQFRTWRIAVREAVASASRDPKAAFLWIQKVEPAATSPGDLSETDGFATLDSKLASALRKVVTGALNRSINVEKEVCFQWQNDDRQTDPANDLRPLPRHRSR